jgi:epoxide hydrolase-like predicted phosphatase
MAPPPDTPEVELVIFDYGGVISERLLDDLSVFETRMGYPPGSIHRLLFGDPASREMAPGSDSGPVDTTYTERPVHDFHLLETGDLAFAEYLEGVTRRAPEIIGRELDANAFIEFTATTGVRVQWPMIHEIRRLRDAGVSRALLTNNVKEFGNSWRASFPVDELFPVVIDSSEVGMRKPDARIYELTCERAGFAPDVSVFLDDNADNVGAARTLGIETVHVGRDPLAAIAELRAILDRRGVRTR